MKRLLAIMVFSLAPFAGADLLIYGGSGHDKFLGCLDCGAYSADSICNSYGKYGNKYSTQGMFNEYSGFGNGYNTSSPWNKYSTSKSVPMLVGRDGEFHGYFTINDSRYNAVDFSSDLNSLYNSLNGDLEKVRKALCKAF